MNSIEILMDEHKNILQLIAYVKKLCCQILEGNEPDIAKFRESIAFARNYADKHHHGKEEKILFQVMLEKLGPVADKLIHQGMLVEHDLGRYHLTELDAALVRYEEAPTTAEKLSIITHAAGYADLLTRHIEKEDGVVFTFAARQLSKEDMDHVDQETKVFEEEAAAGIAQYLTWLKEQH